MATGSYEGSLPMEGTSGHQQPSVFTDRRSGWPRRSPRSSDPRPPLLRSGGRGRACTKVREREEEEGVATGVSEVSSLRAPRGEQARARDLRREANQARGFAFDVEEAEAVSGVVKTPGPSVRPRDDHGSSRASRIAKVVRGAENERRAGHRLGSGGRSRSDASRVSTHREVARPRGVRDASPEEAPSSPDAEHGWREGETVRRSHRTLNRLETRSVCG